MALFNYVITKRLESCDDNMDIIYNKSYTNLALDKTPIDKGKTLGTATFPAQKQSIRDF